MTKKANHSKGNSVQFVEGAAGPLAEEMGLELVEVLLQKESRGKCLTVFVDKEGGLTLDDCEKYHKALQPMLESVDYDIMEVSSPGVDRPVKTQRDFEKNRGNVVEVHLYAPLNGSRLFRGILEDMNPSTVTLSGPEGETMSFDRKTVSLIKPVIELEEEDFEDITFDEAEAEDALGEEMEEETEEETEESRE